MLITGLCLLLANCLWAQTKIELQDAAKHIGETVTVTARVEGIRFYFRMAQRPVVFSLKAPDAPPSAGVADLSLVVNNAEKTSSLKTGSEWNKKLVSATGTIVLNEGQPRIEITQRDQVMVLDKL